MHAPAKAMPSCQLILSQGLPDEAGAARLRQDVPEAEWHWIMRLRRPEDRLRSLTGRALARRLLGRRLGRAPAAVRLGAGPQGKPVLNGDTAPAWHFNIAHSKDLVLVGVGPSPLGVDVEHCPEAVDAALWRQMTGRPLPAGDRTAPAPETFCIEWVRREAVLKACGLGLSADPAALRWVHGDPSRWTPVDGLSAAAGMQVRLLWSGTDHCAAVCLADDAVRPDTGHLYRWRVEDWMSHPDAFDVQP